MPERSFNFTATGDVTFDFTSTGRSTTVINYITLQPQTTAFVPTETRVYNGCKPSIYCPMRAPDASRGGTECVAWDLLNETNNFPFRRECYPGGYMDIWWPVDSPSGACAYRPYLDGGVRKADDKI